MQTLSQIICKARGISPEQGMLRGTCSLCGMQTEHGHEFKDTGSFTTYQYLLGGGIICPECFEMRRNRSHDYRANMWAASPSGFVQFKNADAEYHLCNPPYPPFQMYFTRTWKKMGWINLQNRLNYSSERFVVGFDYDVIAVDATVRDEYLSFIHSLLSVGVGKGEISSGRLSAKTFEKIGFDQAVIDRLNQLKTDPLWDLCVYVARK